MVPARDEWLKDGESCWEAAAVSRHLETQVEILAGELYASFVSKKMNPGERYGDILHRFEKIAKREGVTHLREGSPDLDEKLATWSEAWQNSTAVR